MSTTLEQPVLTTWEDFLELPDPEEEASRYELHDGEVVLVPPPKPIHTLIQMVLAKWLTLAAEGRGLAAMEFSYRPAANLQFWRADVAYVPNDDCASLRGQEWPVYAPPFIAEVLSPSNRRRKIERQRLAAFAGGTREFWLVDPIRRTIEVWMPGKPARIYTVDEDVPLSVIPAAILAARKLFEEQL